MDLQRIYAVVLRYTRLIPRDINRLIMVLYWPLIDILIWGLLGAWMTQQNQNAEYQLNALAVILLWQLVGRLGTELGLVLFEEIWSGNLINFFATPLKLSEWVTAAIVFVSMLISVILVYCSSLIHLIFHVPLIKILPNLLIFGFPLFLSGILLGFCSLNIVLALGKKGSEAAFIVAWGFAPFIGAFYPIEVLPAWAQNISACLPMSYIFEGMRHYIMHGTSPLHNIIIGTAMNIAYLIVMSILFAYMFKRSKNIGLKRLMD